MTPPDHPPRRSALLAPVALLAAMLGWLSTPLWLIVALGEQLHPPDPARYHAEKAAALRNFGLIIALLFALSVRLALRGRRRWPRLSAAVVVVDALWLALVLWGLINF